MPNSTEDKVMTLVKHAGVLRPRDLTQHDISRQYLLRLQRRGRLQKVGRGLYIASETHLTEHHSLVEACKRVPRGIICLLSATMDELWKYAKVCRVANVMRPYLESIA